MRIKSILSVTTLAAIVIFFAYYVATHFSDFRQITVVNPLYLIPLLIISFIFIINNGLVIKYLLEPFSIKLGKREWFGLSVMTSFYNLIMPFRGGAIARAVYLKKRHKFPYTHFLATLSGIYLINFFLASIFGIISLGFIYFLNRMFSIVIFMLLLAVFFPLLFIILFSPRFAERKSNFLNKFIRVINGWHIVRTNRKIVIVALMVILAQLLIGTVNTMIIFQVFGISLAFHKAMFLTSAATLGMFFSITPGSLGIAEAVFVFTSLLIGVTASQSLAAAVLNRVVSAVLIFILGPVFSYILFRKGGS